MDQTQITDTFSVVLCVLVIVAIAVMNLYVSRHRYEIDFQRRDIPKVYRASLAGCMWILGTVLSNDFFPLPMNWRFCMTFNYWMKYMFGANLFISTYTARIVMAYAVSKGLRHVKSLTDIPRIAMNTSMFLACVFGSLFEGTSYRDGVCHSTKSLKGIVLAIMVANCIVSALFLVSLNRGKSFLAIRHQWAVLSLFALDIILIGGITIADKGNTHAAKNVETVLVTISVLYLYMNMVGEVVVSRFRKGNQYQPVDEDELYRIHATGLVWENIKYEPALWKAFERWIRTEAKPITNVAREDIFPELIGSRYNENGIILSMTDVFIEKHKLPPTPREMKVNPLAYLNKASKRVGTRLFGKSSIAENTPERMDLNPVTAVNCYNALVERKNYAGEQPLPNVLEDMGRHINDRFFKANAPEFIHIRNSTWYRMIETGVDLLNPNMYDEVIDYMTTVLKMFYPAFKQHYTQTFVQSESTKRDALISSMEHGLGGLNSHSFIDNPTHAHSIDDEEELGVVSPSFTFLQLNSKLLRSKK